MDKIPVQATVMILVFPSDPIQEIIAGGTGAISAPPFHFILAIMYSSPLPFRQIKFLLTFTKKDI